MSTLAQDLRFAVRTLGRRWMVTALAVLSLGIAIGGNAAVYSLLDAFIFRPLPYPEPERVVLVGERERTQPEFSGTLGSSLPASADWRERSRTVATWAVMQPRTLGVRGTDRAEAVSGVAATPSVFTVLRVSPVRGRLFTEEESVEGGPHVVLLGHEYWARTWGEDRDPLGEVVTINGEPHEIIGVLPPGFGFLTPNQDLWVPLQRSPQAAARDQRDVFVFGRLEPGATTEQAREELTGIAAELETEHPEMQRGWTVDVYNLRHDIPTRQSRILFGMLQGSVVLVLLIACVNVMNLLLARGQERAREIALRTVLGAGRGRIVRQLLTESSLMVAGGGLLGIGLGALGVRAMAANFAGVLPPGFDLRLDGRVVLFTALVSIAAGIVFGVVPALQTFRHGHSEALKEGGGRGGSGKSRKTLSRALVIGEIALSFLALGGGSLLVRSFLQIQSSDPGFSRDAVLTAMVRVPASRQSTDGERVLFQERVLERASEVPGVGAVAMVSTLPQTPIASADTFRVDGSEIEAGIPAPRAMLVRATRRYLDVMGIALVQGRFFESGDRADAAPVVAVNRTLAEARFGNESPLGRRLVVAGDSREIVGVVEDVQQVLMRTGSAASGETVYLPAPQSPTGVGYVVLRTRGQPRAAAEPLRTALEELDPDLTVSQMLTMEEYVDQFMVGVRVFNAVLGGFGLVALLLASLGTYGVLSYSVSRRGHEIGIRMALGAEGPQVVRMIATQGLWLGAIGLGLGTLMTLPLVGVLRSLLEGLSTVQPATLLVIGAILFAVTLTASFVPAGRAAAVDPMRTLRDS